MKNVKITAMRQTCYPELSALFENPIPDHCTIKVGQQWVSVNAQCPDGLCNSAWETLRPFVEALARGEGNFFDGWMKNPHSALLSCNDGFRPVSFLVETVEDGVGE